MAKCTIKAGNEFAEKLSLLGSKTDEIIPRVLDAGGDIVLEKVRHNLNAVLSGESSGELARSLGKSPAKLSRDGDSFDLKIGFAENRADGKSNAMLANILEHGRVNQPPKPFLKPAKRQSQAACEEAMKNKLESEIGGIL
jgi:HK97 gp10 family phage protein